MPLREPRSSELFMEAAMPHADMLHTLARRLCRGREDAEDLVQEVLLRAYAAWHPDRPPRSMGAWLARICVNTSASAGRRRKARPHEHSDDAAMLSMAEPTRTDVLALARIQAEVVASAMSRLTPGQRVVVTLVDLCGFTSGEVARILELPRGTVLSRLFRGHQALAVTLSESVTS
jgi:RNA polymerase sigma-70 factor, ECF subfamily